MDFLFGYIDITPPHTNTNIYLTHIYVHTPKYTLKNIYLIYTNMYLQIFSMTGWICSKRYVHTVTANFMYQCG